MNMVPATHTYTRATTTITCCHGSSTSAASASAAAVAAAVVGSNFRADALPSWVLVFA